MKTHLAKLSLALLSAVFLLGCQEQGSEPVGLDGLGPEFAPGGGGGKGGSGKKGGAALADVTLEDGWLTTAGPEVVSFKDGKKKIEFEYQGDGGFSWAAKMTNTHDAGIADGILNYCVLGGADDDPPEKELELLFDQLIKGETTSPSNFFVRVDKTVLEGDGQSDDHRASVAWPNEDDASPVRHFILRVGTFSELPDLIANVSRSGTFGKSADPLTLVFTGGSVRLRAGRGRLNDNFKLTCPNLDEIIMTLTSLPSS